MSQQMKQLAQQSKFASDQATDQADKLKDANWEKKKPYQDRAKELGKIAEAFRLRAKHAEYYAEIGPQLVNKEIPLTVTFSLNDQHRIVLAYTTGDAEVGKKK